MLPIWLSGMQAVLAAGDGPSAEEAAKARDDGNRADPDRIGAELARPPPVDRRHVGDGEAGGEKDGKMPVHQEKRVKDGGDDAATSQELEDGVPALRRKDVPELMNGQHERQDHQNGEYLAAPAVIGVQRLSHDRSPSNGA